MEFKVDVDGPFTQSPSGTSSLTPSIDQQATASRQVTMRRLPTTAPALSSALMISDRLVVLLKIHRFQVAYLGCSLCRSAPSFADPPPNQIWWGLHCCGLLTSDDLMRVGSSDDSGGTVRGGVGEAATLGWRWEMVMG